MSQAINVTGKFVTLTEDAEGNLDIKLTTSTPEQENTDPFVVLFETGTVQFTTAE